MAEKPKVIDIDGHALLRVEERGLQYGLNYIETTQLVFTTVKRGVSPRRKHLPRTGKTYYHYFHDNLAFYVICREVEYPQHTKIIVKTVIIEEGRE